MDTAQWLTVIGLVGGVIGYLEYRLSRQDTGRHHLRNEVLAKLLEIERELHQQGKTLAKIERIEKERS